MNTHPTNSAQPPQFHSPWPADDRNIQGGYSHAPTAPPTGPAAPAASIVDGSGSLDTQSVIYRTLEHVVDFDEAGDKLNLPPDSLVERPEGKRRPSISQLAGGIHRASSSLHPPRRRSSFFAKETDDEPAGQTVEQEKGPEPEPGSRRSTLGPLSGHLGPIFSRKQKIAITRHPDTVSKRRKFVLKLTKALLAYGAPSHRIESQLTAASKILGVTSSLAYLPNIILVSFTDDETRTTELHFVRSGGRIALTSLNRVHDIYRDVIHDRIGASEGVDALDKILRSPPLYPLIIRCFLAFVCASVICPLSFGGSFIDMWVSGTCACVLQYLGLQAAAKSSVYANVYEISVSIIVSFIARALSSIPGRIFCYSAISSAGVVLILPGFTVLISALELTSRNILCGSVRLVYAIIYTFFLGFGLTIGSDLYLLLNQKARRMMEAMNNPAPEYLHGSFSGINGSNTIEFNGTFGISNATITLHMIKGCYRDPEWPWWRQPFPFWTIYFLVPLYSVCSSLSNLQSWRSWRLPIMVTFSCCSFAANKAGNMFLGDSVDIASAAGALVIGLLGNFYSRFTGGTAFTAMVTGVLFLVPSGLAQAGGLTGNYDSSTDQYYSSFTLGLRMINVAVGVTIGLFVSQTIIYAFGTRKNGGHMAF